MEKDLIEVDKEKVQCQENGQVIKTNKNITSCWLTKIEPQLLIKMKTHLLLIWKQDNQTHNKIRAQQL